MNVIIISYKRSPVHGDGSYPSKNTQADAIHSSIVTNRYLVEAAEMPWSLSLHLVDIASVHLMILKVTRRQALTITCKHGNKTSVIDFVLFPEL